MADVRYAVIGCGQRLRWLAGLLSKQHDIVLAGAWDPDTAASDALCRIGGREDAPEPIRYRSVNALLRDRTVEWVLIGSPNAYHAKHITAAFGAGKHVFAEKPLSTTIRGCTAALEAARESGRLFATGFTLRYAPLYRRARTLIERGVIGKIVSVNASENIPPDHGAYIMTNWRRFAELAGTHVLEKCVHDLDLLNWFTGSVPVRVAAFGGNSIFVPENAELLEKTDVFIDDAKWPGISSLGLNPFTTEKTIEDHLVSILEYANGVQVQFQTTASNAIPERRMYVCGTEGTLILEFYRSLLTYRTIHSDETITIEGLEDHEDPHGGGDKAMIRELAHSMRHGAPPVCSGEEGVRSTVAGIALSAAFRKSRIIDLSRVWKKLGVETGAAAAR